MLRDQIEGPNTKILNDRKKETIERHIQLKENTKMTQKCDSLRAHKASAGI